MYFDFGVVIHNKGYILIITFVILASPKTASHSKSYGAAPHPSKIPHKSSLQSTQTSPNSFHLISFIGPLAMPLIFYQVIYHFHHLQTPETYGKIRWATSTGEALGPAAAGSDRNYQYHGNPRSLHFIDFMGFGVQR